MAMNAANLASEIKSALAAAFGTSYENIPDSHTLTGYDQDAFWDTYWTAVATALINHITTNARATGSDSPSGDSHDLNIV